MNTLTTNFYTFTYTTHKIYSLNPKHHKPVRAVKWPAIVQSEEWAGKGEGGGGMGKDHHITIHITEIIGPGKQQINHNSKQEIIVSNTSEFCAQTDTDMCGYL
mgnify:CR=1 FL=1